MNERFKFRVWDKGNSIFLSNGKNVHAITNLGKLVINKSSEWYGGMENTNPNDYVIQQYTGLKDKNDKDIYEGDIVTFTKRGITHGHYAEDIKNAEVWYSLEDCAFVFGKYKSADYTWWYSMADDLRDFVIVGNIFENPNLLDNTSKV